MITRDRRMRNKPAELWHLREHRIRAFVLAGKRELSKWDKLVLLAKSWERIEDEISGRRAGPWTVEIYPSGRFTDVPLPSRGGR